MKQYTTILLIMLTHSHVHALVNVLEPFKSAELIGLADTDRKKIQKGYQEALKEAEKKLQQQKITQKQFQLYQEDLKKYLLAIIDAVKTEAEEMADKLATISPWSTLLEKDTSQQYIKMASWMKKDIYGKYYASYLDLTKKRSSTETKTKYQTEKDFDSPLVWLTIPVETQLFIRNYKAKHKKAGVQQIQRRLNQYFGLPPDIPGEEPTRVFVTMWVKPEDIIRPCLSTNILGASCPADIYPYQSSAAPFDDMLRFISGTEAYKKWFKNNRNKAYGDYFFPWTRLGYTFDWGSDFTSKKSKKKIPEQGATEFILRPGAQVVIEDVIATENYHKFITVDL